MGILRGEPCLSSQALDHRVRSDSVCQGSATVPLELAPICTLPPTKKGFDQHALCSPLPSCTHIVETSGDTWETCLEERMSQRDEQKTPCLSGISHKALCLSGIDQSERGQTQETILSRTDSNSFESLCLQCWPCPSHLFIHLYNTFLWSLPFGGEG